MRTKNIFNAVFVLGLVLLILNDHYWKDIFGNWYTGKISDFAGILIFPMFLKCCFPIGTKKSIIITILGFIFWKTSASQIFIDRFNAIEWITINRVVDYTDFLAFLMLPISKYVLDHIDLFEIKMRNYVVKKVALNSLFVLSIISFIATSTDPGILPEPLEYVIDCCDFEPINTPVGSGRLYIPTVFTPDNNGLNDFFQVSVDSNIQQIDTFLVFSPITGDTVFNKINMVDIIPQNGFDGLVLDTIIATAYDFKIVVTAKDNVSESFAGKVCCIPCSVPLDIPTPDHLDNCAFPIQFKVDSGYDENIDTEENLDCFQ